MSTGPTDHTMWGIHNDQADIDPVADGAVRIGWDDTGDLSQLSASRDAFKQRLAETMPAVEQKSIPGSAGTLYRFVHEIKVGDVIVSPNRNKRTLNIGRVNGAYQFQPEADIHRHWRPVEWLAVDVPRDELSEAAQNEISSLITLFKINTGREEVEQIIAKPTSMTADFTWTTFYPELADRILGYANDREGQSPRPRASRTCSSTSRATTASTAAMAHCVTSTPSPCSAASTEASSKTPAPRSPKRSPASSESPRRCQPSSRASRSRTTLSRGSSAGRSTADHTTSTPCGGSLPPRSLMRGTPTRTPEKIWSAPSTNVR